MNKWIKTYIVIEVDLKEEAIIIMWCYDVSTEYINEDHPRPASYIKFFKRDYLTGSMEKFL